MRKRYLKNVLKMILSVLALCFLAFFIYYLYGFSQIFSFDKDESSENQYFNHYIYEIEHRKDKNQETHSLQSMTNYNWDYACTEIFLHGNDYSMAIKFFERYNKTDSDTDSQDIYLIKHYLFYKIIKKNNPKVKNFCMSKNAILEFDKEKKIIYVIDPDKK